MTQASRLIVAVDQADQALGVGMAERAARGLLLRFAIIVDREGNVATRVGALPEELARAVRAETPDDARQELAEGLRASARALDAGAGDGRVYPAAELARIIGDLERSHRRAGADATLLELRVRLGRLGLPEEPA